MSRWGSSAIAVGIVLSASVALASTGLTFDAAQTTLTSSMMQLVYWFLGCGLLGIGLMISGMHVSSGFIYQLVVVLFICGLIANHDTLGGLVGVTMASPLDVVEIPSP